MISFIIPAYNEEKYIRNCIYSIQKACPYDHEIIVADDSSKDGTKPFAKGHGALVYTTKCRQLGKIRNFGASKASGDLFVFVDADTMITSSALEEVLSMRNICKAGCAYANYYDLKHSWFHDKMMQFYTWYCSKVWRVCSGYFMWCNARDFKDGFDEDYYLFEDVWFSRKFAKQDFYFGKCRVMTSGRKTWTHNFLLRILPFLVRYTIQGKKLLKKRDKLGIWYDGVR
tara:strand:+ start:1001 stop:1684 length:684 start_codon:yes stop_codon:yes gene_type:complete